jgi:hypothetical protein
MQPFDREYWKKREDQLKEAYLLRGVSRVLGGAGLALLAVTLFLLVTGSFFWWILGIIGFGLTFAGFMTHAVQSAQFKASEAIREEYEHMMRYSEKPKRSGAVRLSDDGELLDDDEMESETKRLRKSRSN